MFKCTKNGELIEDCTDCAKFPCSGPAVPTETDLALGRAKTSNPVYGSTAAMSRWYIEPTYANAHEDDFIRDEILSKLRAPVMWATSRNGALLVSVGDSVGEDVSYGPGRVMAERREDMPGLVQFDYVSDVSKARVVFWMNESSVKEELHSLMADNMDKRVEFDWLFMNFGKRPA